MDGRAINCAIVKHATALYSQSYSDIMKTSSHTIHENHTQGTNELQVRVKLINNPIE